jgi:tRNA pseudouridine55 synthase
LGLVLGCYAHVSALCRLSVGRFTLDAAISLAKLEALGHSPAASGHLLPIETALDDIPALALSGEEAEALRCGRVVTPLRPSDRARIDLLGDGATIRATSDGRLVALAAIDKGLIRPVRVMNF